MKLKNPLNSFYLTVLNQSKQYVLIVGGQDNFDNTDKI
jgi:hypothetical protein